MSTLFFTDEPETLTHSGPTGVTGWMGSETALVSRQFFALDGVQYDYDLSYIGDFQYADPSRPETASGTVTAVTGVFNHDTLIFSWSDFSAPLATMDAADVTVGGWASFYQNVLLPGDDMITSSRTLGEYFQGYGGDDTIATGAGNDTLDGGDGRDVLQGGAGNDSVTGGPGPDAINGNQGADTCDGGDGDDVVHGGQGNDSVSGGAGNDFVSGDRGDDTISGGAGADIFHSSQDAGLDRVVDFHLSEGDRVQLDPGATYTVSQVGSDTVIDMGGANQMILVDVQLSSLTPGWIFGA